jgi:hypothetical protein
MSRKRIRHAKSGAKRSVLHKRLAKCEGCDIVDYEKCRQRSFPVGCYWRDRTPLDLAVRFGMVKRPPSDHEPGVDSDPEMVRFLRDGACKR